MGELDIYVGVILTLVVFSYLFKDNFLYMIVENIFIGVSTAIVMLWGIATVQQYLHQTVYQGDMIVGFIPIVLGGMIVFRYSEKNKWIAKIPLAFLLGIGCAYSLRGIIGASLWSQVTVLATTPLTSISNILSLLFTASVLLFFNHVKTENKVVIGLGSMGKWVFYLGLGISLGYIIMSQLSLLIDRIYFLFSKWL
ncbi:hypothetical protein PRVXH_002429 [Proteinivorax hydrogeniformans]|uniref:Uncharacterized protein n=1 Tax=Proteinivorax hydrogeniformans TaxID=1826727 RepID=A0AAU8HSC9_9FIRM